MRSALTYSYYDDGLRKETFEPGGGRFTYTYDHASQMTLIKNPQDDLTTFEYDDAGRRTVARRLGSRTSLAMGCQTKIAEKSVDAKACVFVRYNLVQQ